MAVPKRVLLLTSAAYAGFRARYGVGFTPFAAQSYVKNTLGVYVVLFFAQLFWGVFVYPLFLTPLRKLPTPEVSTFLSFSSELLSLSIGEAEINTGYGMLIYICVIGRALSSWALC